MTPIHPLLAALNAAAEGHFPPADGTVTFVAPHRRGVEAIVAFTGHAYIMTELSPRELDHLHPDGFGRALDPAIQIRVARGGEIGVNDATLAWRRRSVEPGAVVELTSAHDDHPRVQHARSIRDEVRVYAGADGLVTLSKGLAGRPEMSVEVWSPGRGRGRSLLRAAQALSRSDVLFAAVAPGNARSLRAFLAEGFQPLASEVVIIPGAGAPTKGRESRKVVASDDRR